MDVTDFTTEERQKIRRRLIATSIRLGEPRLLAQILAQYQAVAKVETLDGLAVCELAIEELCEGLINRTHDMLKEIQSWTTPE